MTEHTPEKKTSARHNIALIGFMGTGKSLIARQLHDLYHLETAEMDEIIAEREGMSIPKIFETKGNEYFRTLETNLLLNCSREKILSFPAAEELLSARRMWRP